MKTKILWLFGLLLISINTIGQNVYYLYVGESEYLSPPSPPSGYKIYQTAWGCDEENITVSSLGEQAKITVTGYFTLKGRIQCDYTIYNAEQKGFDHRTEYYFVECRKTNIYLDKEELEMKIGESYTLMESFSPSSAPKPEVYWSTSDYDVAEVSRYGTVTAKKAGIAIITAKTNAGSEVECKVSVVPAGIQATEIKADEKLELRLGSTAKISYSLIPSDAVNSVIFRSSDKEVVTVDGDGNVTSLAVGSAIITIETDNGLSTQCKVTVKEKDVPAIKILANDICLIKLGETKELYWLLQPVDATSKVTFISSDDSIVSVDEKGMLTAHFTGKVTVTIKTDNGLSAQVNVIVESLSAEELMEQNTRILNNASIKMKEFILDYSSQYLLWKKAQEN